MKLGSVSLLVLVGACGGRAAPSTTLTNGVQVQLPLCAYGFNTPAQTTAPTTDDGFAGPSPSPRNLHLEWVSDPSTSLVVTWATEFATTGTTVDFGPTASYGAHAAGFSFAYPTDLDGTDPPSVRIHQVHLCGLSPGTTYHYRAGTGAAVTADATFTTAPAAPATTRILVAGDSRGNVSTWGQVFNAGAAEMPDFAIFTGDANDLGSIQDEWEAWFAAMAPSLPHLPLMVAVGNHEINSRHFYSQFPLPQSRSWYDFDYGDIHFVVLNDTPSDPSSITGAQQQFLDQSLGATTKLFKVVVHHKPPYTSSLGHPSETALQAAWSPTYDKRGVDLVLNGHAHAYERSKPLKANVPVADGQGPVYVVEGGGGADPYDVSPQSFTAVAMKTFGYVLVDVAGRKLTLTAKALGGGVIDTYSITK